MPLLSPVDTLGEIDLNRSAECIVQSENVIWVQHLYYLKMATSITTHISRGRKVMRLQHECHSQYFRRTKEAYSCRAVCLNVPTKLELVVICCQKQMSKEGMMRIVTCPTQSLSA